jgi:hypothetical protein
LKKINLFLIVILTSFNCVAQKIHLQIQGKSLNETKTIDSLHYQTTHKDKESLLEEIKKTQNILLSKGYLTTYLKYNLKINDSSYVALLNLGNKTSFIQILLPPNLALNKILKISKDTTTIHYSELDSFLNDKKQKLNAAGYPLATIRLANIKTSGAYIITKLEIDKNAQKKINAIIVAKSNENNFRFPKGHLKQIVKKYQNTLYSEFTLNEIKKEFDQFNFAQQSKYPETLFTADSTKIYVYLTKQSANNFDGFIGFNTNDNQKITLSGYLDLQLENILNAGEEFRLNWKSNGNNQTTFNSTLEVPYLFGSPIGLKGHINIFKQDSTFQNTKTALEASYFIKHNTRIYLGRETTSSSDIQNSNNNDISDFKSEFYTGTFYYNKKDQTNFMNPIKTSISLKVGIGKRENTNSQTAENTNKQNYVEFKSTNTFYLNDKNHFNTKLIFQALNSKDFGLNELYRFGGFNSIRGFQENSLQAKTYFVVATEYRYLLSPNFYLNTVTDYSYYTVPTIKTTNKNQQNLYSLGLGIGLRTQNGIIKFSAVKNYNNKPKTNIYNTLVHLSYNIIF